VVAGWKRQTPAWTSTVIGCPLVGSTELIRPSRPSI